MIPHSLASILRFVLAERGWDCPPSLEAMADCLPAVSTAGLEIALSGEAPPDLQQRVRGPAETARLSRWIAHLDRPGEPWRRLAGALDGIGDSVEELWLELDNVGAVPPLSIFVRLREHGPSEAMEIVGGVLDAFGVEPGLSGRCSLQRCFDALGSDGGSISHLGMMLGRPGAPMRLILENIPPQKIGAFLEHAGWPGDAAAAAQAADALFFHADRIRLALTLGDAFAPDIGFECFVGDPVRFDPRWRCLFDLLVERGLCDAAARDRLLAWPAMLSPATSPEWPDTLIVDALLRDPPENRWLECRLSHVKLSLKPDASPQAKAYFGFLEVAEANATEALPTRAIPSDRAEPAIAAASDFLLAARNQAGWWLDYDGFSEGPADEWVTAYVAHTLHASSHDGAGEAVARAWHLLERRARRGWGWNFLQPADADSTVWGLRLAADVGALTSGAARDAAAFLATHAGRDGGISTYRREEYQAWLPGEDVNGGWYRPHTCVTAAAAHLTMLGPAPLHYLRGAQTDEGGWRGFWWESDAYATALAAEALAAASGAAEPADSARIARAATTSARWLEGALATGSIASQPFATALALRAARLHPAAPRDRIRAAQDALLEAQLSDGSWSGTARLTIPNRKGDVVQALDNRRCFTTATVLDALLRLKRDEAANRRT